MKNPVLCIRIKKSDISVRLCKVSRGGLCIYCAGKKKDCSQCLEKSFFFPEKSLECSSTKNEKIPDEQVRAEDEQLSFSQRYSGQRTSRRGFPKSLECSSNKVLKKVCCVGVNKNMSRLCKTLDSKNGVEYVAEELIELSGKKLYWDLSVSSKHGKFHIESDGPQHFSIEGMMKVSRNEITKARKKFKNQRANDLMKDDHIRSNGKLLFRFSYRQLGKIPELVERMFKYVEKNKKGVFYLDEVLYKDWGFPLL